MTRSRCRVLAIAGLAILTLTLASGCGSSGSSTSASSSPLQKYAGETIRVLMYQQVPTESTLKRIPEFEKLTGINVEVQNLAEAQMVNKEQLDFTAHTGTYDVTNVHFWYVPQFAQANHLVDLADYVKTDSVPQWDSMSDFVPSYLKSMTYDGRLYGLPFQGIVGILYYRQDLIDKYFNGKVPTTMDELVACAKAITANGKGKVFGYSDRGSADEATFMDPAGWIFAWGKDMIDATTGKSNLRTPEAIAAIKNEVTLLHDYGPPGQAGMGWAEAEQNVLTGVAAMTFDTSDLVADMVDPSKSSVSDTIAFAVPPQQTRAMQDFFSSGLSINADSKNKGAAWYFVQWATSAAVQKEEFEERSDFTVQSLLGSPEFKKRPGGSVILEAAKVADPEYFPATPQFSAIADAFDPIFSEMVAKGPSSVDSLMPEAASAVEAVLNQ